jgi:hypothetical protein
MKTIEPPTTTAKVALRPKDYHRASSVNGQGDLYLNLKN